MCHNLEKAYKSLQYKYMSTIKLCLSRLSHTWGRVRLYRKRVIKKEYIYFALYVSRDKCDNGLWSALNAEKRAGQRVTERDRWWRVLYEIAFIRRALCRSKGYGGGL